MFPCSIYAPKVKSESTSMASVTMSMCLSMSNIFILTPNFWIPNIKFNCSLDSTWLLKPSVSQIEFVITIPSWPAPSPKFYISRQLPIHLPYYPNPRLRIHSWLLPSSHLLALPMNDQTLSVLLSKNIFFYFFLLFRSQALLFIYLLLSTFKLWQVSSLAFWPSF